MAADLDSIKVTIAWHCEAVRHSLQAENEMDVAVTALNALGLAAIPSLIHVLGDENNHVSFVARLALIAMGRPVLPFVIQALATGHVGQRQSACFILDDFAMRDRRCVIAVVPALTAAIEDGDASVRQRAIIALSHFRGEATESLPLLVAALTDDDRRVAEAAAFALGRIAPRSPDVHDVMFPLQHAAENDQSSTVRHTAARAIEKINRMTQR